MKTIVLGVDYSTQLCTIVARQGDDGTIVGTADAAHSQNKPPVSEQDPRAWLDVLREGLHSPCFRLACLVLAPSLKAKKLTPLSVAH
jgi:Sugar (pentulose and hexulose) kinases